MRTGSIDNGRITGNAVPRQREELVLTGAENIDTLDFPRNAETITGSGSLLLSSESDSWNGRRTTPWRSIDNTSPSLSGSHTNHGSTSPMRRKSSNKLIAQPFIESNSGSTSYFTINQGPASVSHGIPSKAGRKTFLDPTSGNFTSSTVFDQAPTGHTSRLNSDDENRHPSQGLAVGGDLGLKGSSGRPAFPSSYSDYNSSTASRSGSLPPGRNDAELPLRRSEERANAQYSHLGPSAPMHSHRQNLSTRSSFSMQTGSYGKHIGDRSSPTHLSALTLDLGKMAVGGRNPNPYVTQPKEDRTINQNGFQPEYSHQIHQQDVADPWMLDENGYQNNQDPLFISNNIPADATFHLHPGQYRGIPPSNATYSHTSETGDPYRVPNTPFYATSNTPSLGVQPAAPRRILKGDNQPNGIPNGQSTALDRNLRGSHQMQQDHPGYPSVPNPMNFRAPFGPYDFHPHGTLRMNPLAPYYHLPPVSTVMSPPMIPRGPAREHDVGQHVRSPLLEEFRNNSKTNKRYELKVGPVPTLVRSIC